MAWREAEVTGLILETAGEMQFREVGSEARVSVILTAPTILPHTASRRRKKSHLLGARGTDQNEKRHEDGHARHLETRGSLLYTLLPAGGKYDVSGRGGKLFIGPFKDRRRPLVMVSRLRIRVECESTREASQGRETTLAPGSDL